MVTKAKQLSDDDAFAVAEMYQSGIGTIHGLAAVYDVAIATIKAALDTYGVPHGIGAGRNVNMRGDSPVITIVREIIRKEEHSGLTAMDLFY